MPTAIALLCAVNLGPHGKLAMADLRTALAGLGYGNVRTLLATGNVLLDAGVAPPELERQLEAALVDRFGLSTEVVVRTPDQWARIIAENPFPDAARSDPAHLVVMLLKASPPPSAVETLRAAIKGREEVEVREGTAYLWYPDNIGDSRLTAAVIDRKLGVRGTGRNWNTALKIAAACGV
jgi:uncharacterized protein (DUF1697 family)